MCSENNVCIPWYPYLIFSPFFFVSSHLGRFERPDRCWCYNLKQTDRSAALLVKLLSWIIINYHKSFNKQNRVRRRWFTTDLWKSPSKSVHRPIHRMSVVYWIGTERDVNLLRTCAGGGMDTNEKCDCLTKDRCTPMLNAQIIWKGTVTNILQTSAIMIWKKSAQKTKNGNWNDKKRLVVWYLNTHSVK